MYSLSDRSPRSRQNPRRRQSSVWVALLALTASIDQQPIVINRRTAASGRRHWCCLCPSIRRRIINVVLTDVVCLASGASPHDVDFAVNDCDTHMITCKRHRRFFGPLIGRRVIYFVNIKRRWVMRASAKDVNFSVDLGGANRSTPRTKRWKPLPRIRRRIVYKSGVLSVGVNETGEASERIKFMVEAYHTDMA